MIKKRCISNLFFIFGITFSMLLAILFPESFHLGDMKNLSRWAQHWSDSWRDIYINCQKCNYPFIGIVAYAGIASISGITDDFLRGAFNYRLFLSIIDGINVLLIYYLFKEFQVEHPKFWAAIIGILPSSWAGGALWGQIDDVGQIFILASLIWIVYNNNRVTKLYQNFFWLYISVGSLLLSFAALTKQLTVFSVFSIGLLLFANILIYSRRWQQICAYTLISICIFIVLNLFIDLLLSLKEPYFSHLAYIWLNKSGHINKISGNGFNIWMFLGKGMWSSSNDPFFFILTPKMTGVFLYIIYLLTISCAIYIYLKEVYKAKNTFLCRKTLLIWIFFLALVNLGFNVLLSGTHERYLYHFYPFIILSFLGLRNFEKKLLNINIAIYISLSCSIIYGLFVILRQYHLLVGTIHLVFLIYLLFLFLKSTVSKASISTR